MKVKTTTQKCPLNGSTTFTEKSVIRLAITDDKKRKVNDIRIPLITHGWMMIARKIDKVFQRREYTFTLRIKRKETGETLIFSTVEARSKLHARLILWAYFYGTECHVIYTGVKTNTDSSPDNS